MTDEISNECAQFVERGQACLILCNSPTTAISKLNKLRIVPHLNTFVTLMRGASFSNNVSIWKKKETWSLQLLLNVKFILVACITLDSDELSELSFVRGWAFYCVQNNNPNAILNCKLCNEIDTAIGWSWSLTISLCRDTACPCRRSNYKLLLLVYKLYVGKSCVR